MDGYIKERIVTAAEYIIENNATVRQTGKALGISKSTVHMDMRKRLPLIDSELYENVCKVIDNNLKERHIRGGESTRKRYLQIVKH
ncbi:MAG: sporulation transcriptional regulator SpoIIID [Clostridia bacterium]|nr:sporulation transcriptional regulator SpoIIID [Clostridia bacterium]